MDLKINIFMIQPSWHKYYNNMKLLTVFNKII